VTRRLVATILLDELQSTVPGERELFACTVSIGGKVIRFEPSQSYGLQLHLVAQAVLEERERAARSALPDCVNGEERP
jgi:hypothetical protein